MATEELAGHQVEPLWRPSADRVAASQIDRFRRRYLPGSSDSDDLWRWSVDQSGSFWRALWDWSGIIGEPGLVDVAPGDEFWQTRFLPEARLNVAENLLAERSGAADPAIVALAEGPDGAPPERVEVTWRQLREDVAATAQALRAAGIGPGDRVAAWMPHRTETVVAFLAAASMGAVFTSTSADFGVDGVVDRFGQTQPKVLLAADGYRYGGRTFPLMDRLAEIVEALPTVEVVLVAGAIEARPDLAPLEASTEQRGLTVQHWDDMVKANRGADLHFDQLPGDHPLYILYSSGTTGKPKCIVHRAGGVLLKHLCEQRLHGDIGPGDRVFFFTTCGWMMWNWLVSALGCGATIVLYDGNPGYPTMASLFELAEGEAVTYFGVSAKFIDGVMKSGYHPADNLDLTSIRTINSTGSPLSHEGFAWIYDAVATDAHLASISGGTDLCGCLVLGDPTKAVYAGEIQGKALGLDIEVFDDGGQPVGPGVKGELVCRNPFPSMPLGFWADDGDRRYRAAYFDRFDNTWAHGDFASWTERGGMVIHGRSDATLNASGVRIGTAEIYRVVEQLPEVAEAIAIGQEWDGDTRVVLFVKMAEGCDLDDELTGRIRRELRTKCSPRHVPGVVATVADIPRTRSGKIVELAVTEVVHGRPVLNLEALANPEALDHFADRPELMA